MTSSFCHLQNRMVPAYHRQANGMKHTAKIFLGPSFKWHPVFFPQFSPPSRKLAESHREGAARQKAFSDKQCPPVSSPHLPSDNCHGRTNMTGIRACDLTRCSRRLNPLIPMEGSVPEEKRLRYTAALPLIQLPAEDQYLLALLAVKKDLTIAEIRAVIRQKVREGRAT